MPKIAHPYQALIEKCRQAGVTLVVVSKTRTEKQILTIYEMGQRFFAENRAHELIIKASLLPSDIEWHLIGHLQTNKVKSIIPYITWVQSLDSWKLWMKLQEEAKAAGKYINCLLEIKVAKELTKYGWTMDELDQVLSSGFSSGLSHIKICGVMGMTSLTDDREQVRKEMKLLKTYYDHIKHTYFKNSDQFNILSMGMSGDYEIALEEGSTMIRVGSLLFK